jgi:cellobiose phosphorylase
LWAYGISGDLPIVLITIAESRNLPLVRDVLLAHAYWRLRGFKADLVILDTRRMRASIAPAAFSCATGKLSRRIIELS